jgi:hypothetical protein
MAGIGEQWVKMSLVTWLPLCQRSEFLQTMERIGFAIGEKQIGVEAITDYWGRLTKIVNTHFSTPDKQ